MRVIGESEPTGVYGGHFIGDVRLSMLRAAPADGEPDVALVAFSDGAVTCWHAHPGGQLIYVVRGTGVVGTDDQSGVVLAPGTLVEAPAGERHWHGAAPGQDATLLCFTWGATEWTDEAPHS